MRQRPNREIYVTDEVCPQCLRAGPERDVPACCTLSMRMFSLEQGQPDAWWHLLPENSIQLWALPWKMLQLHLIFYSQLLFASEGCSGELRSQHVSTISSLLCSLTVLQTIKSRPHSSHQLQERIVPQSKRSILQALYSPVSTLLQLSCCAVLAAEAGTKSWTGILKEQCYKNARVSPLSRGID